MKKLKEAYLKTQIGLSKINLIVDDIGLHNSAYKAFIECKTLMEFINKNKNNILVNL